ncbi:MAG: hypothetical protein ABIP30_11455 [Ferruginibacter sp.]
MTVNFESEKNKKAFIYTAIICGGLLLMFFLISWTVQPVTPPVVQDLMEINLGNNQDGFGEEQPLIKGERSPTKEEIIQPKQTSAPQQAAEEKVQPDENAEATAAPVNKPVKSSPKVKTVTEPAPVVTPVPKPQKPKITYNGAGKGGGNNATEDNGYKYQGNTPGGKGDNGDPNGNKDSYGNTPGGKVGGGLRVSKGDRSIINNYIFVGTLGKATIYAIIKVSPDGKGIFITFDKGSTSTESKFADAIRNYLPNIKFNKSDHESIVTVPFNFKVQ